MLRILLAIDDYGEMVYLQTLLRKLGMDVDSAQNQRTFGSKLLGFNPQFIFASADGRKINGIELADSVRKRDGVPRFILLVQPQQVEEIKSKEIYQVDGYIESPVNAKDILTKLGEFGQVDSQALMDKYNKMKSQMHPDEDGDLSILRGDSNYSEVVNIKGAKSENIGLTNIKDSSNESVELNFSKTTSLTTEKRNAIYQKALEGLPEPKVNGFKKDKVVSENKELRKSENIEQLASLEEERRNYTNAMFKLAKKVKDS